MKRVTTEFDVQPSTPGQTDQAVICTACWRHCIIGYLAVHQEPPIEWIVTIDVPKDCPLEIVE